MLSVIIITKNEEHHIARCLKSVTWADELIVVDSGSTDNTVEIAKELGAKVLETDWPGFGIQKQRALDLATQEWVLNLDADEFLDEHAKTQILKALHQTEIDAYQLPIMMVFKNQLMRFAGCETKHIRLFRRLKAHYSSDKVHEKICLPTDARVRKSNARILHESYLNWFDAVDKMNHYSSLSANKKRHTPSIFKAMIASKWLFFRNYFIKGWMLDGKAGLALAVYQAQGSWYRYLKQVFPD